MNRFRLKACAKCQGDLVLDEGDWLCLQCGTYYYTGLYRKHGLTQWPQPTEAPPRLEKALRPCNTILPCHSERSEESGEAGRDLCLDSSVAALTRNAMAEVSLKTLRLDKLAADSLAGQEVSIPLAQSCELPLPANLNASMGFQCRNPRPSWAEYRLHSLHPQSVALPTPLGL